MSQSVVDCCNSALQKLGAGSIINILDNSREARACNLAFDSNRRSELRKRLWNFATKRVALASDLTAPSFDYAYQFTLPSDCLRVILPNDSGLDWVLEGRKLLTNSLKSPFLSNIVNSQGVVATTTTLAPQLNLRYVADITDVTQWDSTFYDLVALAMATDMCEALTNSTSKKSALSAEYRDTVADARLANAFEQLPADAPDDSWWTVRY